MSSSPITEGISHLIRDSIEVAITNNSLDTYKSLNSFVRQILALSIENNSLHDFNDYIYIPSLSYYITFKKVQGNSNYNVLYNHVSKNSVSMLYELIKYDLSYYMNHYTELQDLVKLNDFYLSSFNAYSDLLLVFIQNRDNKSFELGVSKLNEIEDPTFGKSQQLELGISILGNSITEDVKNNYLKEYNKPIELRNHTLLGLKSWLYHLFRIDKLKQEELSSFISKFKGRTIPFRLKDILFFRMNNKDVYLDWKFWRYHEESYEKPIFSTHPYSWLTFGFLVEQIQSDSSYLYADGLDLQELSSVKFLYNEVDSFCENLKKDFNKWGTALNIKSLKVLEERCNSLLSILGDLMKRESDIVEKQTINSSLDLSLIQKCKETIRDSWEKQARVRKLFKKFENRVEIISKEEKLTSVSLSILIKGGKGMFIKDNSKNYVTNFDQIGGQLGQKENDFFFYTISKQNIPRIEGNGIVEVLEKSITKLNKENNKATVILIPPEFRFENKELVNHNKFRRTSAEEEEELISSELLHFGYFDSIPMFYSYSEYLRGKVLVCDFKEAFKLSYREISDATNKILKIDIDTFTEDHANFKLQSDRENWTKKGDGFYLSDEEAINFIQTSVEINVETQMKFEILNGEAYVLGLIK